MVCTQNNHGNNAINCQTLFYNNCVNSRAMIGSGLWPMRVFFKNNSLIMNYRALIGLTLWSMRGLEPLAMLEKPQEIIKA